MTRSFMPENNPPLPFFYNSSSHFKSVSDSNLTINTLSNSPSTLYKYNPYNKTNFNCYGVTNSVKGPTQRQLNYNTPQQRNVCGEKYQHSKPFQSGFKKKGFKKRNEVSYKKHDKLQTNFCNNKKLNFIREIMKIQEKTLFEAQWELSNSNVEVSTLLSCLTNIWQTSKTTSSKVCDILNLVDGIFDVSQPCEEEKECKEQAEVIISESQAKELLRKFCFLLAESKRLQSLLETKNEPKKFSYIPVPESQNYPLFLGQLETRQEEQEHQERLIIKKRKKRDSNKLWLEKIYTSLPPIQTFLKSFEGFRSLVVSIKKQLKSEKKEIKLQEESVTCQRKVILPKEKLKDLLNELYNIEYTSFKPIKGDRRGYESESDSDLGHTYLTLNTDLYSVSD